MICFSEIENKIEICSGICIYGLGFLGKKLCYDIPELFGTKATFFCDSNDKKVDECDIAEMQPIYKRDLLKMDENFVVFVLVDDPYDVEIQRELSANSNLTVVTLRELTHMQEVISSFYGKEIFEGYQKLEDYEG